MLPVESPMRGEGECLKGDHLCRLLCGSRRVGTYQTILIFTVEKGTAAGNKAGILTIDEWPSEESDTGDFCGEEVGRKAQIKGGGHGRSSGETTGHEAKSYR